MTSTLNVSKIEPLSGSGTLHLGSDSSNTVSINTTTQAVTLANDLTVSGNLVVSTIKEGVGGSNTAMTIDTTGRILTPARPAFRGTKEYTATNFTTETDIVSYTEDFDIGSAFDATAGTYTVPVTGIYQINVQQYGNANFSAATQTILRLYIDGAVDNFDLLVDDPEGGQSSSLTIAQTKSLTAGQVLKVSFEVITDTSVGLRIVFSGFLVG